MGASRAQMDFAQTLDDQSTDAATKFFELANAKEVTFELVPRRPVKVHQDTEIAGTGGIVWETSYLLALLLQHGLKQGDKPPCRVLEIGAGCGLLGIALGTLDLSVVVTEQVSAMANLQHNVTANREVAKGNVTAEQLIWGEEEDIGRVAQQRPFD